MADTEVLGIEIKQYVSDTKQRTLVPKLLGRTTASVQVKKKQVFEWTEELFLDKVQSSSGEPARYIVEKLLADFKHLNCQIRWGKGATQGGFTVFYKKHRLFPVYALKHSTTIEIPFIELNAPFDTDAQKTILIARFSQIPQLRIPENPQRPSFDCTLLKSHSSYTQFMNICQEMVEEIEEYEGR